MENITQNNNSKIIVVVNMGYEYVKETIIKDKSENEKKLELIVSIIKTKNDLQNVNNNYEYAEGDLIDYFLYEIKANETLNSILGRILIYIVNIIGASFNFHIGLNGITALFTESLGVPGVLVLIVLKKIV